MDVLSEVLRGVRLTGAVFFDMKAHAPWVGTTPKSSVIASLVMPNAERVICFHILVTGDAWAALEDGSSRHAVIRRRRRDRCKRRLAFSLFSPGHAQRSQP